MDDETRGFIEKAMDDALEKKIVSCIEWLQDVLPIKSLEDVALGYAIGMLERFARDIIVIGGRGLTEEDQNEIMSILKRRLPEIREKILAELSR